jgi:cytochrome c553
MTFASVLLAAASALSADDVAALRQNCVACHGGIADGKKRVEGSFDITPLLKDGIQDRHTQDWVTVVEQLRTKTMPPADSRYRLSETQRQATIDSVLAKLDRGEIQERLLTPFEIANTYAKVFGLDRAIYDPFQKLFFLENIDSAYPTINSPSLMSAAYLREIEAGLDLTLDHAVANGFARIAGINKKYRNQNRFELRFTVTRTTMDRTGVTYLAFIEQPKLPIDSDTIKNTADNAERNRLKAINAKVIQAHKQRILETKNLDALELRMRGTNRLSCREYGVNLPIGRYRLTFTASARNRDLVKRVAESSKKGKAADLGTFRELYGAKAGLAIRHGGINKSRRGGLAAHTIKGKLLHYFEIEDNTTRPYTCEFELAIPGQIEMDFVNGPWSSRLNRINLGGLSGREEDPNKYGLPCIRIDSKIILERIGDPAAANSQYQIASGDTPSDLQQKLSRLVAEFSLDAKASELVSIHGRLDPSFSPQQRYTQALKWIAMSPSQLYIRYDPKDSIASSRFVSYAFLKQHPTELFQADYKRFRAGTLSASDFAKRIISDPAFDEFLDIFGKHWLENRTVLDETRFGKLELALPFGSETRHYFQHLFSQNRPALELVASDDRMLSAPMASFYGMTADGLDRHVPQLVRTPAQGGLVHQANFFVARSDGVDPRPFSRAAWIVKNVFGQRLSEPPGDINADQFVATAKTATFEERVKIHSMNKACIGCHKKLDPIAFALNDYDTIGRLVGKPNLEAKRQLTARLKGAGRTMARTFARNLIAFAIGRDTNIHDMQTVETILDNTAKDGHRVRDILAEILKAYFRT